MKIEGTPYRTIWLDAEDRWSVHIIDQTKLPWKLEIVRLTDLPGAAHAIKSMQVRGAPLIGATAAYGLCLALRADTSTPAMERAAETLAATRPTAVNLRWALGRMLTRLRNTREGERVRTAYAEAAAIADEDAAQCEAIGGHGAPLIEEVAERRGRRVNVLTHCNAGWLATVDWGTALAPIYKAHDRATRAHR
jgi:methylthioribose-1-phosphate isomerase